MTESKKLQINGPALHDHLNFFRRQRAICHWATKICRYIICTCGVCNVYCAFFSA